MSWVCTGSEASAAFRRAATRIGSSPVKAIEALVGSVTLISGQRQIALILTPGTKRLLIDYFNEVYCKHLIKNAPGLWRDGLVDTLKSSFEKDVDCFAFFYWKCIESLQ